MGPSMTTMPHQKQAISRSHLQLVPIERTAEQHLDLELVEAIVGLQIPEGQQRPLRFYKIAKGELYPVRVLARCITDALHAEVDPAALMRALWMPIKRFIERKSQRRLPRKRDDKLLPAG
jgi:hypothetical protein